MGIEGYSLWVYTNDLDAVATSALKMVSLELDLDTDIRILQSSIKLCRDNVGFATILCKKKTHWFGKIAFFVCVFNCNAKYNDMAFGWSCHVMPQQ